MPGPGDARPDWRIAADFARRLEARLQPANLARSGTRFGYASPAEIFAEHAATTRGRDLDITGLSHEGLDARGPQQWPCADGASHGAARLYADGVFPTADGRARFAAAEALARVQAQLRCGTNCGSCLPELRLLTQVAA